MKVYALKRDSLDLLFNFVHLGTLLRTVWLTFKSSIQPLNEKDLVNTSLLEDDLLNDVEVPSEVKIQELFSGITLLFTGLFLAFLIFLSVAGNILVCVAVATDRSLRKIGNLFIVSLAVSDLLVAGLVMVFAVPNDLTGYWIFGSQFCDTWIAFDVMGCTASILNLCAISLDRYIHIKDPLRYCQWMTKRVICVSIASIWILAGLISFLPISLDLHRPPNNKLKIGGDVIPYCALDLTPTYAVVSSCISFYLPCLVMLGIYSRLYYYAKMHVEQIKAQTRPVVLGLLEGEEEQVINQSYPVSDHKAAKTVGIIMGVFLVCWVPFFCINIVTAFCKTCIPELAFKVLTWLGYSNSAFNPIIYSIFNLEFREAFQKILSDRCTKPRNSRRSTACSTDPIHPHAVYINDNGKRYSSDSAIVSGISSKRVSNALLPSHML
ncbi:dopamine receptor 1-like isoform X2 [Artemia franciscana]|uniref:dopamine receptor 1-like isoform X2 n=1 Tax=Artemia franciscana TaxID=6661 RepID=UPI0032DA5EE3